MNGVAGEQLVQGRGRAAVDAIAGGAVGSDGNADGTGRAGRAAGARRRSPTHRTQTGTRTTPTHAAHHHRYLHPLAAGRHNLKLLC